MNLWPTLRCPFCKSTLPNREVRFRKAVTCPKCLRQLRFSRRYLRLIWWTSISISLFLCYFAGFRGWRLVVASIVAWLPVDLALTFLTDRIISPPMEIFEMSIVPSRRASPMTAIPLDGQVLTNGIVGYWPIGEPAEKSHSDQDCAANDGAFGVGFTAVLYQGSGPSSLKTPPVGPSSGRSARRTGVAAPCSTVFFPVCRFISVAVKPGFPEFTLIPVPLSKLAK